MNKKRFAKELLYFLSLFFVGILVLPALLTVILSGRERFWAEFGLFYAALVDKSQFWIPWLVALGPYLLFQFIRSVIWAWKTTRS